MSEAAIGNHVFAPEIEGIACVYLPVANVYRSVRWYQDNLGLQPSHHNPIVPTMDLAIMIYPVGGPAVFLVQTSGNTTNGFLAKDGYEMPSLCFAVKGIQRMYDRLVDSGVRVEAEVEDRGGCGHNFKFFDPDGNKFDVNEAPSRF